MDGATRDGAAQPTSRYQNKKKEWGQGKANETKNRNWEKIHGAKTEVARQNRAAPPVTERKEKSSTCAWTGDHSCHAQRTDDGRGRDARS